MNSSNRFSLLLSVLFTVILLPGCVTSAEDQTDPIAVNTEQLLDDVKYLASDSLEGRRTGSDGGRIAADFIEERFAKLGLNRFGQEYRQHFEHVNSRTGEQFDEAVNLVGYLEGREHPERFIVLTAHYDHLGRVDGEIHNGADDNASGTAGLLEAARHFSERQPANSIIFIAFDAEEQGLGGSIYFIENPPLPLESMVININLDMISVSESEQLYAAGTWHYNFLRPLVEEAVDRAAVEVLFGYDSPESADDWTFASDHGPFHREGIPFLYFGVEDHPRYHQPDDTFENIHHDFFVRATETVIGVLSHLDQNLHRVIEAADRPAPVSGS